VAEFPENKSNALPIPALTSIVVALAAVLANQLNPLDSPRPIIPNDISAEYGDIQDVNARLWQDPFTAISQRRTDADTADKVTDGGNKECSKLELTGPVDKKCIHTLNALINSIVGMPNNQNITVLGIMVPGGSYAENIEHRRRTRYAVLSGLAVKGYAPKDHEHIGYLENLIGGNLALMPKKIPFEWFIPDKDNQAPVPVLVLWLDDSAFSSMPHPLKVISDFVNCIKNPISSCQVDPQSLNKGNDKAPNLTVKIIGPASSDTLQVMVNELKCQSFCPTEYHFEFYNAAATGDWPGIKIPPTEKEGADTYKKTFLTYLQTKDPNTTLMTRTSLTDFQLAETIAAELKLRDFKIEKGSPYPRNNKDHIVIISEWDTIFGRLGLPNAMNEQLVPMDSHCSKKEIRENNCNWPSDVNWIHPFSYMRGLDGIIPGAEKKSEEAKANKDKDTNSSAEINLERSEGQHQQDYLRRLTANINEIEQQLKNDSEGQIKAIGVLGSDAYDKLMILKALRPSFPKAIFFTTDLDARLMHPKEFDVTRNLVVASSFDLKLAENLQKSIPPFRDSYQTAHFFATQIALDNVNGEKLNQRQINAMLGRPRLFETGNNKAIPLNPNKDDDSCTTLQNCNSVHPIAPPKNKRLGLWVQTNPIWIICLACFFSKKCRTYLKELYQFVKDCIAFDIRLCHLICPYMTAKVEPIAGLKKQLALYLVPQLLILFVVAATFFVVHSEILLGDDGEPFFWNAGISVWPSEIIRLFAGIFGCLFIAKTINDLSAGNEELAKKFHLKNTFSTIKEVNQSKAAKVVILWDEYLDEILNRKHMNKIVMFSVVFFIFAGLLIWTFGLPSVPSRGEASQLANTLVLGFSVPVFVILVMTVFVTTIQSVDLITQLGECDSVWPDSTLDKFDLMSNNKELTKLCKKLEANKKYHLGEWLDIRFIAAHTESVGKLVYYPFIILALMIFARSKIFDNWDMPISLVLIFLSTAILTLGSAFFLRRAAERVRQNTIKKISSMKMALACQPESYSPACKAMEKQIDLALTQIQEIKEGAFQPLSHEPAFQAFLIPFGSFGGVALLENLVLYGVL